MESKDAKNRELYFDEPRLKMTVAGRFTVRVVSYVSYLVLISAAGTFLLSESHALRSLGIFLVLFLLDRVVHRKQEDKSIAEMPVGPVNLAHFAAPGTFAVLGRAFDRGLVTKR